MQIKVNLCRGPTLAAPIVLDLALFMDSRRAPGSRGQEWLSYYFKSPQPSSLMPAEHDLFIQVTKLKNTLRGWMGEAPVTHSEADWTDED
ncbi:MAG: inositol-3-phosphate synthase [Acidimicrobiales bacterium]